LGCTETLENEIVKVMKEVRDLESSLPKPMVDYFQEKVEYNFEDRDEDFGTEDRYLEINYEKMPKVLRRPEINQDKEEFIFGANKAKV